MIFISLFLLLFLGCDNSINGNDKNDLMINEINSNINSSWTYEFNESIYNFSSNHTVTRTIINPNSIEFDFSLECDNNDNILYIFSEGHWEGDSDSWFEGVLDIDNDSPGNNEVSIIEPQFFQYSAYLIDSNNYKFCSNIYEYNDNEQNQSNQGFGGDSYFAVTKIGTFPYNIFNLVDVEYPLYIGKTWTIINEPLSPIQYIVQDVEQIVLNIQGNPTTFESYKIIVDIPGVEKVEYYFSNYGLLKLYVESGEMNVTTEDNPEGYEETYQSIIDIELIDYSFE